MTIKQITRIPMFTTLVIVCTLLIPAVPILGVPFTLQTFVVMLAGLTLRPYEAFMSMVLYLIIGAIGFPVFSGFKSGMGVLLGPTGGFLIAFPFAAMLISYLRKVSNKSGYLLLVTVLGGVILVYSIGIPFLSLNLGINLVSGFKAMAIFILFDGLKAIFAVYIKQRMTVFNESTK